MAAVRGLRADPGCSRRVRAGDLPTSASPGGALQSRRRAGAHARSADPVLGDRHPVRRGDVVPAAAGEPRHRLCADPRLLSDRRDAGIVEPRSGGARRVRGDHPDAGPRAARPDRPCDRRPAGVPRDLSPAALRAGLRAAGRGRACAAPDPRRFRMRLRLGGIGHALADRNFRIFSIGSVTSWFSFFVQVVAVSWTAWELTHSTTWRAIIALLEIAPNVLLVPLGSVLADRYDRFRIEIVAYFLALLQAL